MKELVELRKGMFITDYEWKKDGTFISEIFDTNTNTLLKPPPVHFWLVERNEQKHIFLLNDDELNKYFGGNHPDGDSRMQTLESELAKDGFTVHRTISSQADLDAAKKQYPNLDVILGSDYFGHSRRKEEQEMEATPVQQSSLEHYVNQASAEIAVLVMLKFPLEAKWSWLKRHGIHVLLKDMNGVPQKCAVGDLVFFCEKVTERIFSIILLAKIEEDGTPRALANEAEAMLGIVHDHTGSRYRH